MSTPKTNDPKSSSTTPSSLKQMMGSIQSKGSRFKESAIKTGSQLRAKGSETLQSFTDSQRRQTIIAQQKKLYLENPILFLNLCILVAIMSIISYKINKNSQSKYEYIVLVSSILVIFMVIFQVNILMTLLCMLVCLAFSILAYLENKQVSVDEKSIKQNELLLACILLSGLFLLLNVVILFFNIHDARQQEQVIEPTGGGTQPNQPRFLTRAWNYLWDKNNWIQLQKELGAY